ncbi:PREDICTED: nuclear factor erythroid 2-related factor 2-like [Papilio xuthus]|uniref:Nuclear factor erythroid 2-related factor 2-like n=1 Tax=Papilio xuthus TaxID=66420 RepID=A0AAJ7EIP1_PAPXU|nr:PREDICTED: nuclear factor erythroid 2-related factor 2-like [Papilio xuthus]
MDEFGKHSASYQLDQEILDARGINMKVEEVAGLSTCKYSARVQALHLSDDDLAFLKGLRRRIKNRLASQNSRRRSIEHLRRLARELRAVRACREDVLSERRSLLAQRDEIRTHCLRLRRHLVQVLRDRSDTTLVPQEDLEIDELTEESQTVKPSNRMNETKCNFKNRIENYQDDIKKNIFNDEKIYTKSNMLEEDLNDMKIFECRIDKLVQQSVNHIFKEDKKKICAKTIFITENILEERNDGVLNLSVKEGRRKSHGRKQSAPRRIPYVYGNDGVLDLKIKKEPQ